MSYQQPLTSFSNASLNRGVVAPEFASLYEAFNPLTTVAKQRFVEWFSGQALDTNWNLVNTLGTITLSMADVVDGGLNMATTATNGHRGYISRNNKRHFDEDASVCITIFQRVGVNTVSASGLEKTHGDTGSSTSNCAGALDASSQTFKRLFTSDGTLTQQQDSTVAVDTNWTTYVIKMLASSVTLDIAGVLEVTNTLRLPTDTVEPFCQSWSLASSVANSRFRYMECYNT